MIDTIIYIYIFYNKQNAILLWWAIFKWALFWWVSRVLNLLDKLIFLISKNLLDKLMKNTNNYLFIRLFLWTIKLGDRVGLVSFIL